MKGLAGYFLLGLLTSIVLSALGYQSFYLHGVLGMICGGFGSYEMLKQMKEDDNDKDKA